MTTPRRLRRPEANRGHYSSRWLSNRADAYAKRNSPRRCECGRYSPGLFMPWVGEYHYSDRCEVPA